MTIGIDIMKLLFLQVFQPENLNASLLIDKKYKGKCLADTKGYSPAVVYRQRKLVLAFCRKMQKEWELYLQLVETMTRARRGSGEE